ncbi:hypothetical protein YP94_004699 [Salmonella enterica subsp. enterica]|uniref:Uncharacterized protein n=1 Tax=Salmonella derby TaxID=28144 RepID=A0A739SS59_SALDE|nr:hypothetical protein [Salmonella enterica subsp. enterica]EDU1640740.1 hypothetical protein [Salmonella enterica subsp. enterica serovar Saintpaul]EDV5161938.1 hypothetical protein [Salmonella enterica subsp. enterica serovar Hato]EDV6046032.1 hypothetical protein [Salmonella enterica]HAE4697612.1 hypothetical protein [Salmonella enterica subsp. enterica serovar Enteritidis]HAE9592834.1 hypothetical protein [Salmonella enterica subsp. enterica serovar Derby]
MSVNMSITRFDIGKIVMSNDYRLPDSEYLARRFSVPHLVCLMAILLILSIFSKGSICL